MLTLELFLNIFVSLSVLSLGALVLVKNFHSKANRSFFLFSLFISLWVITNYFSNDHSIDFELVKAANHLVLLFPALALINLLKFTALLAGSRKWLQRWPAFLVVALPISALTLTPLMITNIVEQGDVYALEFGDISIFYFLLLAFCAISISWILLRGIRKAESFSQRRQLLTVLYSLVAFMAITIVLNLLLPMLAGSFELTSIGPFASIILVGGIAYAIVKHRLFDIRLVIARSLAYILTLGILFVGYVIVSSFILRAVLGENSANLTVTLVNALFLALSVLVYQPVKRFFDRATNRIFYRDAYDPQAFLDELNKTVVSNIELGILLRQASAVIEKNLKCEFCVAGIKQAEVEDLRVMGSPGFELKPSQMKSIKNELAKQSKKTLQTEAIIALHSKLKQELNESNIAVITRMNSGAGEHQENIGYLMLGPKKSGNLYSSGDMRIIEIVADELVIAIQNSLRFEEIQSFAATLQAKVNEATAKLKHTNEKLKALDQTKDEFISMASHQLRTPLTSVKGYLSMVLEGDAGKLEPMQKQLLNQAFVSSQRMVYLIADLLNVSRLKTGKFVIEAMPTNLTTVVESEITQLQDVARGKKIKLDYQKPKNFPDLLLDETKIRQVIMNFVDNGIYYTPSGGQVKIELKEDRSNIYFFVKDNGLGIPKEEQKHLFTKFFRASNARKARPDGTGLGLFMAKRVIESQGGDILFESVEGKGSTFGFSFSKAKLKPQEHKKR